MTADKPTPRLAPISQWLASAGHSRAWRLKQEHGRLRELLRLDSSRSGWAVGEHSDLVHHHGVPIHLRTVLLKSP